MSSPKGDTIAAIATPAGRGGIGVVRVSGAAAAEIARRVVGRLPEEREATLADFRDADGGVIDRGLALFFQAPRSFTGEAVLELHGHGGPVVMDMLLRATCAAGARLARPGEFTERAFLNDKMDLAQAEAVADLIDSASRRAARSALRSLSGEFSARVHAIDRDLLALRVHVEAAMDFADEEIDFLADAELAERLAHASGRLGELLAQSRSGRVLREGFQVAIAGPPNAGKSSLLNRLAAEDRAIVSELPGTTRDLVVADIELDGIPVRVTDTAGLREGGDAVERIGVQRARAAIAEADLVLMVADDSLDAPAAPSALEGVEGVEGKRLEVCNKVDASGRRPGVGAAGQLFVSARTGSGMDALRRAIAAAAGVPGEGAFMARERHVEALSDAARHVANAGARTAAGAGDLAAEELRLAQHALGRIVGSTSVDALLGEIFKGFCIGK